MATTPNTENGSVFLSAEVFNSFEKKLAEADSAKSTLKGALADIPSISGASSSDSRLVQTLTKGISPEQAQEMLATDIQTAEEAVRSTLKTCGVTKVPQNVFDGLVSFYNQVADITYAYVGGSKVDLTGLYKNAEWDRAASFIAADDRDRARRIREASMIVSNDYGPDVEEATIVRQGLDNANELLLKGKINKQTGDPATDQQVLAAASNYLAQTGNAIPNQSFAITTSASNNDLDKIVNQATGPWPY